MGQTDVATTFGGAEMRTFVKALLEDVQALERVLAEGRIESGIRRIGAEQEIFLVGRGGKPRNTASQILARLENPARFSAELGRFNLEINLAPQELGGGCLSAMERELREGMAQARAAAEAEDTLLVLTGILPTVEKSHLTLESMTANPRFARLNEIMSALRGEKFHFTIKGKDELITSHDNVMLEACNTSFQVHFQVGAEEFAYLYNLAQAVTAPVLAAATNAPLLFQHRLWHETRVALFQQSLDIRSEAKTARGARQRVSFGDRWIERSVLEIFREDIARLRPLVTVDVGQPSLEILERGETPPLSALCLFNGTTYRWNRPVYGVKDGVAHLRIEHRVLPAGPTILDEVANAAFFFGLMLALDEEYGDVTRVMGFDDARDNFINAARYGLKARFQWAGGKTTSADELILDHLLPLARQGLARRGIPSEDVDRYLGTIEERVRSGRTGSQWALDSLAAMGGEGRPSERMRALVLAMAEHASAEPVRPVHEWSLATLADQEIDRDAWRTVRQVMTTDLFTVHPEDLIDLAAALMDWEHLRHVPVEDNDGILVGLLSHRGLLRLVARGSREGGGPVAAREVMKTELTTVSPDTSCRDAIDLMRMNKVGCLPVVDDGKLVGIVTEHDFGELAQRLMDRFLREE